MASWEDAVNIAGPGNTSLLISFLTYVMRNPGKMALTNLKFVTEGPRGGPRILFAMRKIGRGLRLYSTNIKAVPRWEANGSL
jgi:hypothetical protein